MAAQIQIPRGNINKKGKGALLKGEFFWQVKNLGERSDVPFDEGTLYIGRPDLNDGSAIPIAGARSVNGLVLRGTLSATSAITDSVFAHACVGDFWIFSEPSTTGSFHTVYDFKKDDLLLVTAVTKDETTGAVTLVNGVPQITFVRINASGGRAADVYFDNTNTNFSATNVSDALKELELEKLSYRGEISSSTDAIISGADRGAMYLVTTDGVVFPTATSTFSAEKGDFVFYQSPTLKWRRIPCGYTDAEDIDFDASTLSMFTTAEASHITAAKAITNVQMAIKFLLEKKAQLDANGKVPVSQLPATLLGGVQYKGVWDPINNILGVKDKAYQNKWPGYTYDANGNVLTGPEDGDYYIVTTLITGAVNIQYVDEFSKQPDGSYARTLELNTGDWIVWTNSPVDTDGETGHWQKVDNSDRISVLRVLTNATISGIHAISFSPEVKNDLVGTPTIGSSHKIAVYDDNGTMRIAGIRLIDQSDVADGASNRVPRYKAYSGSDAPNTIENSNIEDTSAAGTVIHHNLQVGTDQSPQSESVFGEIKLFPQLKDVSGVVRRVASHFEIFAINYDESTTPGNPATYKKQVVKSQDAKFDDESVVLFPESSSTIVGKLTDITFVPGRIVKSIRDGYIESCSIEEHMGKDADGKDYPAIIEIHSEALSTERLNLRKLSFGVRSRLGNGFTSGVLDDSLIADVYGNADQKAAKIDVTLPARSGVLVNETDWKDDISGTEKTLPIFGPPRNDRSTIIDSKIRQRNSALVDAFKKSSGYDADVGSNDSQILEALLTPGAVDNVEINADVLIGHIDEASGELSDRALQITKALLLGNSKTNMTVLTPGRAIFATDTQYFDPTTGEARPVKMVIVEPPADSGVLLTSNSKVDGGTWL